MKRLIKTVAGQQFIKESFVDMKLNPFQSSVVFHEKTSFCSAKQMTSFSMKQIFTIKIYVGRLFIKIRFSVNFDSQFLLISAKIPWKFKKKIKFTRTTFLQVTDFPQILHLILSKFKRINFYSTWNWFQGG